MSDRLSPKANPVGSRLLVEEYSWSQAAGIEVIILEWSPSGKRVKLRFPGGDSWQIASKFVIRERLESKPEDMIIEWGVDPKAPTRTVEELTAVEDLVARRLARVNKFFEKLKEAQTVCPEKDEDDCNRLREQIMHLQKILTQTKQDRNATVRSMIECKKTRKALVMQLEHLAKFKNYVHDKLDNIGVPTFKDQGLDCRVGARLNWLSEVARSRNVACPACGAAFQIGDEE